MGIRMIIIAPEPQDFTVTLDQFREASTFWGSHATLVGALPTTTPSTPTSRSTAPEAPLFQIFHFNNNAMLSTDGTEEQAAEVAAWAANTFPKAGPGELWMTDQGYTGHTVLTPGMKAADIWKGWQELS